MADGWPIQARFEAGIDKISSARAIVLGVPSDVGAGYRRGANLGPQAIRSGLLAADRDLRGWYDRRGIVDMGSGRVIGMRDVGRLRPVGHAMLPWTPG